jgi:hypothetical protein
MTVREQRRRSAGLGPWSLFQQQELAARVVDAGLVQVDHYLEREHQVAVQISVQGVPVLWPVLKENCR